MSIFLSYRYTNIPKETLENTVTKFVLNLRNQNIDIFCNLEEDEKYIKNKYTTKMIMNECFEELEKCNTHITLIFPESGIGEGMLLELGYALKLKLKTLLLIPKDYNGNTLRSVVDKYIDYRDFDELLKMDFKEILKF
ncbi:hypothetical protein Hokovirus_2_53 [Hokovirus HKV1]|uniref:Nucleoside 2-deoxyribosyltransferase n=1 Tax=Hokovirus HKV1 TaxID=1977638 RepID=A0A1V0SFM2_9VIRU|nr:hypothetical protein Hokovirus_2_53 [Hokovirus HKV1]